MLCVCMRVLCVCMCVYACVCMCMHVYACVCMHVCVVCMYMDASASRARTWMHLCRVHVHGCICYFQPTEMLQVANSTLFGSVFFEIGSFVFEHEHCVPANY